MIEKFYNQEDGNIGIYLGHSRLLRHGYISTIEIMDGNNDQILIAHIWAPKMSANSMLHLAQGTTPTMNYSTVSSVQPPGCCRNQRLV